MSRVACLLLVAFMPLGCNRAKPAPAPTASKSSSAEVAMNELAIAPDVASRLAKLAPHRVDVDESRLAPDDRRVLRLLVEASQLMHQTFLAQIDPAIPTLRAELVAKPGREAALRYFDIMAGPWDSLDHDRPFVGTRPRPPGAAFYPADMTRDELNRFVAEHPAEKDAFQSYFTRIERKAGRLVAVPYSEAYRAWLEPAAAKLKQAASLTKEPTLKRFLELRAQAFASNDYFESDKAWMDVIGPIEVTIGPYETYADQLFQYKASFEAFIALRDAEESRQLEVIGRQMEALERNLPLEERFRAQSRGRGKASPISVVQLVANAGQEGVQPIAYNLPNDERVRSEKGSKKVMMKNLILAKFEGIVRPIAALVIDGAQLEYLSGEAMFAFVLLHEVSHGLGPGYALAADGTRSDVHKALRDLYGGLEEAKADVAGLVSAQYLIDRGLYPRSLEKPLYVSYLATAFREMRFGVKEAHGKGVAASLRYLLARGAVRHDAAAGKFSVDFVRIKPVLRDLASLYLTLEASGDYQAARQFFAEHAELAPELAQAIARIPPAIPVDIAPEFTIYEKMKSW